MDTPQGPAPNVPALVGRDRERAVLHAALTAALAGRGSLVLIGGEAGIGKTALAEALLAEAAAQGALVLVGRCHDLSETPPYGPWAEALARAPAGDALPPLPGAVRPEPGGDPTPGGQEAVARRRARRGRPRPAAARPVALLLDDLHWADPASRDLLRVVARGLADLPLLLLATYRADEVARDHPLAALLPLLVREARAARLDPRPLTPDDLRALVRPRYALPPADEDRLVAYLDARTEGNPLYAGEVLRALAEAGTLPRAGADGALGDLTAARVPTLLRQVIDGRVARLGPGAREALTAAAVLGQAVPLALWAALSGAAEDALVAVAERAVAAGLLAEAADGAGVRFTHALIRETLYEGLGALRRPGWHRRAAEVLLATPDPDADAVAYHFRRAGDARAAAWLERAGARACRAYAWLTAAARYEAALALAGGPGDAPGRRARLLLTLAQLQRYNDPARGIPLAAEAARLATMAGDATLAAAARFDHGHLLGLAGDHRAGLAAMAAAWPALAGLSPGERGRLPALIVQGVAPTEDYHRGALVHWHAQLGHCATALALGAPFAARAPGTTPRGLQGLGLAYATLGRSAEAHRTYDDARAAYLAADQRREVGHIRILELEWALRYHPDQPPLIARLAGAVEGANRDSTGVQPDVTPGLAYLPLFGLTARWDEARALGRAAQAAAREARWLHTWPWLGRLLRAQGDRAAAWALVGHVMTAGPATEPGDAMFAQALEAQYLALALALDAGDLPTARAWLAAYDRWLAWSGAVLGRAEGQLGWAAYHRASGDAVAARACAETALNHATAPRQPLALLAAHLCWPFTPSAMIFWQSIRTSAKNSPRIE